MKPIGWRGESYRHYLSAKGVRTGTGISRGDQQRAYFMAITKALPHYQLAEIEKKYGREKAQEARQVLLDAAAKGEPMSARDLAELYGVAYVRKPRFGLVPQRAYEGERVVESLHQEQPGRVILDDVTPQIAFDAALQAEGNLMYRRNKAELEDQMYLQKRRIEGYEDDLARAKETAGISYEGNQLVQRLLERAKADYARQKDALEKMEEAARRREFGDFVSDSRREEIRRRIFGPPIEEVKAAQAREDAIAFPVEPVVIPQEPSWRRKDVRSMQTRVSKFFVRKQVMHDV